MLIREINQGPAAAAGGMRQAVDTPQEGRDEEQAAAAAAAAAAAVPGESDGGGEARGGAGLEGGGTGARGENESLGQREGERRQRKAFTDIEASGGEKLAGQRKDGEGGRGGGGEDQGDPLHQVGGDSMRLSDSMSGHFERGDQSDMSPTVRLEMTETFVAFCIVRMDMSELYAIEVDWRPPTNDSQRGDDQQQRPPDVPRLPTPRGAPSDTEAMEVTERGELDSKLGLSDHLAAFSISSLTPRAPADLDDFESSSIDAEYAPELQISDNMIGFSNLSGGGGGHSDSSSTGKGSSAATSRQSSRPSTRGSATRPRSRQGSARRPLSQLTNVSIAFSSGGFGDTPRGAGSAPTARQAPPTADVTSRPASRQLSSRARPGDLSQIAEASASLEHGRWSVGVGDGEGGEDGGRPERIRSGSRRDVRASSVDVDVLLVDDDVGGVSRPGTGYSSGVFPFPAHANPRHHNTFKPEIAESLRKRTELCWTKGG